MQAVRQADSICESRYYIYSLVANNPGSSFRGVQVTEIKEEKMGTSNTGFESKTIQNMDISSFFSGTYTTSFEYKQTEMEISEDGSKLAIVENNYILVYEINTSNHKIGSLLKQFEHNPSLDFSIGGIEFADNNTIVFSRYDSDKLGQSWCLYMGYSWILKSYKNCKL